jgi:hypothetical protein
MHVKKYDAFGKQSQNPLLLDLNDRIKTTVERIDAWIESLPITADLVGFGAGGRGVMTLAALNNSNRFKALFDSNFDSNRFLTPKTKIPIVGQESWIKYADAYCLIFSFGYLNEIKIQLAGNLFSADKIFSLADFYPSLSNN